MSKFILLKAFDIGTEDYFRDFMSLGPNDIKSRMRLTPVSKTKIAFNFEFGE
jgi:hypothetical protein